MPTRRKCPGRYLQVHLGFEQRDGLDRLTAIACRPGEAYQSLSVIGFSGAVLCRRRSRTCNSPSAVAKTPCPRPHRRRWPGRNRCRSSSIARPPAAIFAFRYRLGGRCSPWRRGAARLAGLAPGDCVGGSLRWQTRRMLPLRRVSAAKHDYIARGVAAPAFRIGRRGRRSALACIGPTSATSVRARMGHPLRSQRRDRRWPITTSTWRSSVRKWTGIAI